MGWKLLLVSVTIGPMQQSLVIIKPDALQRGIGGDIITRFERAGLKMVGCKMLNPDRQLADQHYPKDRDTFIVGMAQKTLESCKEQGIDVIEQFGTDDPKEIGLKLQNWLVDFITSSPVLAMVFEGPNAIEVIRKITGPTMPAKAAPGTIRGDYSFDSAAQANVDKRPVRNLIHASGDAEEAAFEIKLWFKSDELFEYDTIHQQHMMV
jgi:nucleoside-diphosphate kinase